MSEHASALIVVPPGLGDITSHHEATGGMGGLAPRAQLFPYPPQIAATCVAAARAAGLAVDFLDAQGTQMLVGAVLRHTAAHPAQVLAVLVSHGTTLADMNFLRLLQRAPLERKVLLFGPSAHLAPQAWLGERLASACLLGEPEGAIAEAISQLAAGPLTGAVHARELAPQWYLEDDLLTDLDGLPYPAWDQAPWQPYGMVSLLSSRGCPDACRFCAYKALQGHQTRCQGTERTLAEWAWLANQIKPPYLLIRDPVFAQDRARVQALCEGIIRQGIQIPWACESRPEHFDHELLGLMRVAGCVTVKIGMESGDADFLAEIGRIETSDAAQTYLDHVGRVAKSCRTWGLCCRVFVMVGVPGQTDASLTQTYAALRRLPAETHIHARPFRIYPATDISGPALAVEPQTLTWLEKANHPRPPAWRRALGIAKQCLKGNPQPTIPAVPKPVSDAAPLSPRALAGQRVFLTGGNGFLGNYVAQALVDAGAEVVALVRPTSPLGTLANLPVQIVHGDLTVPQTWRNALRGSDLCFHVAALFGGAGDADAMYVVNAAGTSALLAACAASGVRRVVHTSTIGTVGRPANPDRLPDEQTPFNLWQPSSHYVKSKYLGELIARCWAEADLDVVIVKPTAPVGAGDDRPTATGRRILAALRGQVTAYPPGGINHVPVQDVAQGHILAALRGKPGQIYILGHHAGNLDHAAFLRLIAEAADTAPLRPSTGQEMGSQIPAALTVDPSHSIRELGLPQSDLRAAFVEAVTWYTTRRK